SSRRTMACRMMMELCPPLTGGGGRQLIALPEHLDLRSAGTNRQPPNRGSVISAASLVLEPGREPDRDRGISRSVSVDVIAHYLVRRGARGVRLVTVRTTRPLSHGQLDSCRRPAAA